MHRFLFSDASELSRRQFLGSGAGLLGIALAGLFPKASFSAFDDANRQQIKFTVLDGGACQGCRKWLDRFIAMNRFELSACFPENGEIFFAIGRNHRTVPDQTIAVGNCASFLGNKTVVTIPGCPPVERQALDAIRNARMKFIRPGKD